MADRQRTSPRIWTNLLATAKPFRWHIAALFLLSLLAIPLALLVPFPLKIAVDSAIGSVPLPGFLRGLLPDSLIGSPAGVRNRVRGQPPAPKERPAAI